MDFEIFIVKVDQFNLTCGHIPRYMYVIQVVQGRQPSVKTLGYVCPNIVVPSKVTIPCFLEQDFWQDVTGVIKPRGSKPFPRLLATVRLERGKCADSRDILLFFCVIFRFGIIDLQK